MKILILLVLLVMCESNEIIMIMCDININNVWSNIIIINY